MTPDEQRQLKELYDWMQQRKRQQISLPLDNASKNASGFLAYTGVGATTKTQVYTDSHGDTVTAPKAYAQTVLVTINGATYEIPSLV